MSGTRACQPTVRRPTHPTRAPHTPLRVVADRRGGTASAPPSPTLRGRVAATRPTRASAARRLRPPSWWLCAAAPPPPYPARVIAGRGAVGVAPPPPPRPIPRPPTRPSTSPRPPVPTPSARGTAVAARGRPHGGVLSAHTPVGTSRPRCPLTPPLPRGVVAHGRFPLPVYPPRPPPRPTALSLCDACAPPRAATAPSPHPGGAAGP